MTGTKFPYTLTPGSLETFLSEVPSRGVPDKITTTYLKGIGYASSNHRAFISPLKHVGLIDGDSAPTERYRKGLRGGADGKKLVAEGIRAGYEELFATYPRADREPDDRIATFISGNSDLGDRARRAAVSTFKTFCKFGDFEIDDHVGASNQTTVPNTRRDDGEALDRRVDKDLEGSRSGPSQGAVTINVNIALAVDATNDASVYDAFFAAMAKHIAVLGDGRVTS